MSEQLRLYHWMGKKYNYLCMSESVDAARVALLHNISGPGGEEARALGDEELLRGEPTFIAEANYPIVIWP